MGSREALIEEILHLKMQKNAVIFVHNYQRPEVQALADYLGDSLDLAKAARKVDNPVVVLCGVHFMAETVKILSPSKTVLLPEEKAGCPLAGFATAENVREMRQQHPNAVFIAYVNTSAEVKAECDCCATSANAVKIIRHYHDKEIVYLPDQHLARYASHLLGRQIITWQGECYVHANLITPKDIDHLRRLHPQAIVMAHPEVPLEIARSADVVAGTSAMILEAGRRSEKEFIVVTEIGLVNRLRHLYPDKVFYELQAAVCSQMKLTSLRSLANSLRMMQYRIEVAPETARKARIALETMLDISR